MIDNLTVSTATPSRMLVKLADVKTELGITGTGDDSKLTRQIIAASRAATGAEGLRRQPWLETVLQKLPGRGGKYLKLERWPILSVTSVTEGTGSSPTTVDSTTYSIAGNSRRDRLYRVNGWSWHSKETADTFFDVDGPQLGYNATYVAGWVMPDQITPWTAAKSVAANAWYSAKDAANGVQSDNPFIFQADSSGGTTHASTEPTWPTTIGGTVTDNGITWTAYDQRIPEDVEEVMLYQVMEWFRSGVLSAPPGVRSERDGPTEISYFESAGGASLFGATSAVLARYR